ncbi:MAG: tetratricopeptide repeat protein [Candidatus Omnitrophica bacterium]|nr:tetratricopeptide repeat protein [Candidatus Omnitrophota bacterium]
MNSFSLRLIVFFLGVVVFAFCFAAESRIFAQEDTYIQELRGHCEGFIKENNFTQLFDYLDSLAQDHVKPEYIFYQKYYSVKGKSLYLDYLEMNEDWAQFYEQLHVFDNQIIETAEIYVNTYPLNGQVIDLQYLLWRAYLREEGQETTEIAFGKLVDMVIFYTQENNDIAKFKEIVELISREKSGDFLAQMFAEYRDYLENEDTDPSLISQFAGIADSYLDDGNSEVASLIYNQYVEIICKRFSVQDAYLKLKIIADKFRHYGFFSAKDPGLAELIYEKIKGLIGNESLKEEDVLARGYNFECEGNYAKADEEYRAFAENFKENRFLPEIYTRLGIINLYYLGNQEQSLNYFKTVAEKYPDSFYESFCLYRIGLILQWKKEFESADEFYARIKNDDPQIKQLAEKRRDEIKNNLEIAQESLYPLELLYKQNKSPSIILTLKSIPARCLINQQVEWIASAQDYSVGTVQPFFAYQWFGDTGTNTDIGSVTKFTASYASSGPKLVFFSAGNAAGEEVVCGELWVYDIGVISPAQGQIFKVNELVLFEAGLLPLSPEDGIFQWSWKVFLEGEEILSSHARTFNFSFDKQGKYTVEIELKVEDSRISKTIAFEVIE